MSDNVKYFECFFAYLSIFEGILPMAFGKNIFAEAFVSCVCVLLVPHLNVRR